MAAVDDRVAQQQGAQQQVALTPHCTWLKMSSLVKLQMQASQHRISGSCLCIYMKSIQLYLLQACFKLLLRWLGKDMQLECGSDFTCPTTSLPYRHGMLCWQAMSRTGHDLACISALIWLASLLEDLQSAARSAGVYGAGRWHSAEVYEKWCAGAQGGMAS